MADHAIWLNLPAFGYDATVRASSEYASIFRVPQVFSKKNPELYTWGIAPFGPINTSVRSSHTVSSRDHCVRCAVINALFDDMEEKSFRVLHIIYLILRYNIYDNMFYGYHPLWSEVSQKWQVEVLHLVLLECMEKAVQAPSDLKSLEDCIRRQLGEDLNDHVLQSQPADLPSKLQKLVEDCSIRGRRNESWEAKPVEWPQRLEEQIKFRNSRINELQLKLVSALDHLVVDGISGGDKLGHVLGLIDHWLKSSYRDFLFNLSLKMAGCCIFEGHSYVFSIPQVQQESSLFKYDVWNIRFTLRSMLGDAAYILHVLLSMLCDETGNVRLKRSSFIGDMCKLENQVPLILLRIVFAGLFLFSPECFEAFLTYSSYFIMPFRFNPKRRLCMPHGFKQNYHLLDCIRETLMVMTAEPEQVEEATSFPHPLSKLLRRFFTWPVRRFFISQRVFPSHSLFVPHAVELSKAGIKFKGSDSAGIKNIRFRKRTCTLFIPQLVIRDSFETFWRNLAVFENVFYEKLGQSEAGIVSFLYLMDDLIDSNEDVKLLRKHEIIVTNLGDDKVAELVNSLTDSLGRGQFEHIDAVVTEINEIYAKRKWRILWSEFVETYFKKPWLLISAITETCFLLIQTVLQILSSFSGEDKLKLG